MIWSVRDYRSRKTVARKPGYATSPQAHQRSAGWLLRFYINHVFVHFCSSTPVYVPSVYTIHFFQMTADVIFFILYLYPLWLFETICLRIKVAFPCSVWFSLEVIFCNGRDRFASVRFGRRRRSSLISSCPHNLIMNMLG